VASNNNPADAEEVFERHPEMRIKREDLAAFEANWDDKPASMRKIAETLDIGLDALAFVDDNPAERQIVRRLVPEVDVVTLPPDPADYTRALASYLGFETVAVTDEDRQRTVQYQARAAARELASSAADIGEFLRDLRMSAEIAPFDDLNFARIVQLIGKTNQFNLTTRRHGAAEVRAFMESPSHITRYLKLSDRFADHGLTALAIAAVDGDTADIETFLMSCRVIGRTVEDALLGALSREAIAAGCTRMRGTYLPTAKNAIVRDLYGRFGFEQVGSAGDGGTVWEYDLAGRGPIASEFIAERR
jgi:FkbH-like protein